MTQFHESIKTILSDFERFLDNLTPSALPATAKSEKTRIANEIARLKSQYPQLQGDQGSRTSEVYDDNLVAPSWSSGVQEPQSDEILYEDTESIPPPSPKSPAPAPTGKANRIYDEPGPGDKGVHELKVGVKKEGYLKMRKEKKKLIGTGAKKVFCMISEAKILYIFASNTSKKQMMAFALKGYHASALTESANKKEFAFQLYTPDKPVHIFVATKKEEMAEWITAFNRLSGGYDTRPPATPAPPPEEENTYAEANEGRPSEIVKQVSVTAAAAAADDEPPLYDEANIPAAEPAKEVTRRPPPPEPDMYYDDTEAHMPEDVKDDDGDIYEDGESIVQAVDISRGKSVMSAGYADKPALPPRSFNDEGNKDYDQMYYGLYDCDTEQPDELPFKRGDIMEVVNRDYDSYNWWVAKFNGRMGIVPKDYLTKAYELVR